MNYQLFLVGKSIFWKLIRLLVTTDTPTIKICNNYLAEIFEYLDWVDPVKLPSSTKLPPSDFFVWGKKILRFK